MVSPLLKKIKTNLEFSHIPIILLTAKNTLQSRMEGLELGAERLHRQTFLHGSIAYPSDEPAEQPEQYACLLFQLADCQYQIHGLHEGGREVLEETERYHRQPYKTT